MELYIATGAGQRAHSIYLYNISIYISVQPPTHWVYIINRKHLYKVMSFMNILMGHIQNPQGNYCIVGKLGGD